jgi:hypothetical protein
MGRKTVAVTALVKARVVRSEESSLGATAHALTARFHQARADWIRDSVDVVVELGGILLEGKRSLGPAFHRWIAEELHVEPATARNYIRLAEFSRHSPAAIERFKALGVAKLYKIARLPPPARDAVLHTPEVDQLTDGEFHTLTSSYLTPARKVSGNMRAHGLRQKVRASTTMLLKPPPARIEDDEMRRGLKQDLLELARTARALAMRIKG